MYVLCSPPVCNVKSYTSTPFFLSLLPAWFQIPCVLFPRFCPKCFPTAVSVNTEPFGQAGGAGQGQLWVYGVPQNWQTGIGSWWRRKVFVFFYYSSFQEEAWSVCVFAELSCHHVLAYVLSKGWGRGSHQETYVLGWQHWEQTMLCSFQPTADQDDSHSAAF